MLQLVKGDEGKAASLQAYLASRDPQQLAQKAQHLDFVLDGQQYSLSHGQHYSLPGSDAADGSRTKA